MIPKHQDQCLNEYVQNGHIQLFPPPPTAFNLSRVGMYDNDRLSSSKSSTIGHFSCAEFSP